MRPRTPLLQHRLLLTPPLLQGRNVPGAPFGLPHPLSVREPPCSDSGPLLQRRRRRRECRQVREGQLREQGCSGLRQLLLPSWAPWPPPQAEAAPPPGGRADRGNLEGPMAGQSREAAALSPQKVQASCEQSPNTGQQGRGAGSERGGGGGSSTSPAEGQPRPHAGGGMQQAKGGEGRARLSLQPKLRGGWK